MKFSSLLRYALAVFAGFCVTVSYVALALAGVVGQNDLRQGAVVIFSMMLIAGFLCGGKERSPLLIGCLVASGLIVPVVVLNLSGLAMTNDVAAVTNCAIS